MAFAAYLLENVILVFSRGGAFIPTVGFCMNARLHRKIFAAFPKQKGKFPTMPWWGVGGGGEWARLGH